jgi:hypothetical protein
MAPYRPAGRDELVLQILTETDEVGRARLICHRIGYRLDLDDPAGHCGQVHFVNVEDLIAEHLTATDPLLVGTLIQAITVFPYDGGAPVVHHRCGTTSDRSRTATAGLPVQGPEMSVVVSA